MHQLIDFTELCANRKQKFSFKRVTFIHIYISHSHPYQSNRTLIIFMRQQRRDFQCELKSCVRWERKGDLRKSWNCVGMKTNVKPVFKLFCNHSGGSQQMTSKTRKTADFISYSNNWKIYWILFIVWFHLLHRSLTDFTCKYKAQVVQNWPKS